MTWAVAACTGRGKERLGLTSCSRPKSRGSRRTPVQRKPGQQTASKEEAVQQSEGRQEEVEWQGGQEEVKWWASWGSGGGREQPLDSIQWL